MDPQTDFRRPGTVSYAFLSQPQQTVYSRALTNNSLGNTVFADIAEQHLRRAAEGAGWPFESWYDVPVFIGSSSYTIAEYENRHRADNTDIGERGLFYLAEDSRKRSGSRQIFSLATVCTSSAHALTRADNCLHGGTECAFVLGIENLNRLTLLHFRSLGLSTKRYQPFGGNGLILGEGVAALAFSVALPDRTGRLKLVGHIANTGNDLIQSNSKALEQVIRRILNVAAVLPENIVVVKAHGIDTAGSDAAELTALEDVFGTPSPLMVFKAQISHILGITAALEVALLLFALK